jgi:ComF family protein
LVQKDTGWLRALLDLMFPQCCCLSCGKNETTKSLGLCSKCLKDFDRLQEGYSSCSFCAAFVPENKNYCANCFGEVFYWFDLARAVFPYEGGVKEILHRFKYRGMRNLARSLGILMQETLKKSYNYRKFDLVIPVPLHPSRLQERGYNQSELLAREIARGLRIPLGESILVRHVNTPSQTGFGRTDRYLNLKKAFALTSKESIRGKNVLLVDDIFTTGATTAACSRVLKKGGADYVFVIVFAAGKTH